MDERFVEAARAALKFGDFPIECLPEWRQRELEAAARLAESMYEEGRAEREADVAEARRVAEEACDRHNALLEDRRILRCAFCNDEYPPDTPPTQAEALTEHVKVCAAHPMREVERERDDAYERGVSAGLEQGERSAWLLRKFGPNAAADAFAIAHEKRLHEEGKAEVLEHMADRIRRRGGVGYGAGMDRALSLVEEMQADTRAATEALQDNIRALLPSRASEQVQERPLRLVWGEHERGGRRHVEWHAPCGCAYHPEGEQGPHIHPCAGHAQEQVVGNMPGGAGSERPSVPGPSSSDVPEDQTDMRCALLKTDHEWEPEQGAGAPEIEWEDDIPGEPFPRTEADPGVPLREILDDAEMMRERWSHVDGAERMIDALVSLARDRVADRARLAELEAERDALNVCSATLALEHQEEVDALRQRAEALLKGLDEQIGESADQGMLRLVEVRSWIRAAIRAWEEESHAAE